MRGYAVFLCCYIACFITISQSQYSATYYPGINSLPKTSENGQVGTNECGTHSSASSMCQNLYVNSATDFCLWGPKGPGLQGVGASEREVVSYCTKDGRGTRLIPPGTLQSVHFVKTPHYIQISGLGKLSNLNISPQAGGGELDPHGQDGRGNPIGGLVFTSAFGKHMVQAHEWTSFIDDTSFCLRVCNDGDLATTYCKHIYDEMGCVYNMPTTPDQQGIFESCEGQDAEVVGVYTNNGSPSTFYQSQTLNGSPAPPAKPPPAVSQCTKFPSTMLQGSLAQPFANAGMAVFSHENHHKTSSSSSSISSSLSAGFFSSAATSSGQAFNGSSAMKPSMSSSRSSSRTSPVSPKLSSTTSTNMVADTASSSKGPVLDFGGSGAAVSTRDVICIYTWLALALACTVPVFL